MHCVILRGTCLMSTLLCAILGQQSSSTSTNVSGKWIENPEFLSTAHLPEETCRHCLPNCEEVKKKTEGKTHLCVTLNFLQTSGWILSNGIISTIPEVVYWCSSKNDFSPRCDSRNLGLSPLCDLDRNIPMPARYKIAVLCDAIPVSIYERIAFTDIVRLSLRSTQKLLLLTWRGQKHRPPWGF